MSALLICRLRWCLRGVLPSRVYLLRVAFLSLWGPPLPYNKHGVLIGDDKEHPIGFRFRDEQVTQTRSIWSFVYYFLTGVATLRLQSIRSLYNMPLPHGGTCLREGKVHMRGSRDRSRGSPQSVESLGLVAQEAPHLSLPFCSLLSTR